MVDSWMRSRQSLDEILSFFRIGRAGRGLGAAPKLATFDAPHGRPPAGYVFSPAPVRRIASNLYRLVEAAKG